jgi:adenine-specific DNA-methyltransferase
MNPDDIITHDCLPILAGMQDLSIDTVITDPPYLGSFTDNVIDGIAALYLCAKKARKHIVFFWSPLVDPPRPPPGWFHTATSIWSKIDARSRHNYEVIVVWSRDYKRQPHKVYAMPILDYRTIKDWQPQHPTQKPLKLLRYLVEDYSTEGDLILDPFAGIGTTAVAAQQLKRHYLAIETNPEYARFAQQRLQPKQAEAKTEATTPATEPTTKKKHKPS